MLHNFADTLINEGRDVVCIAVDQVAANSLGELRNELGLQHELIEVLRNWPGDRVGILVIDALDACRGDRAANPLLTLIREVVKTNGRWHVVASIRKYDLRYNPGLKEFFRRGSQRERIPSSGTRSSLPSAMSTYRCSAMRRLTQFGDKHRHWISF